MQKKNYGSTINVLESVQFLSYYALTCLMHWIYLNIFSIATQQNNLYINTTWIRLHLTSSWKLATSNSSALGFTKERKLDKDARTNIKYLYERSWINRDQH